MLINDLLHSPDKLVKIAVWLRSLGIVLLGFWLAGWLLVVLNTWNTFQFQAILHPNLPPSAQMIAAAQSSIRAVFAYLASASAILVCWGASEMIYLLLDIEFNTRAEADENQ